MSAAARWRSALESWALPDALLAQAEESPYGFDYDFWQREPVVPVAPSPTKRVIRSLLDTGDVLLDVGAGIGGSSLWATEDGIHVIAVEKNPEAVQTLRLRAAGRSVEVIEGAWPAVAAVTPVADVALAAYVVHGVLDIVPFLEALHTKARIAVVLELPETHPRRGLAPLFVAIHGLDLPMGPTVDDLVAVIREALDLDPTIEIWSQPTTLWFDSWEEAARFYRRRAIVPAGRTSDLMALLDAMLIQDGAVVRPSEIRQLACVWWKTG